MLKEIGRIIRTRALTGTLAVAVAAGGLSAEACQAQPKIIDGSSTPPTSLQTPKNTIDASPTPTPEATLSPVAEIMAKAKQEGIIPSKTEQDLWHSQQEEVNYPNFDPNLSIEELTIQRANFTLKLMTASENTHYQDAIIILKNPQVTLTVGDLKNVNADTQIDGNISDNGEARFAIIISTKFINDPLKSNPIILATKYVDLASKVERLIDHENNPSFQALSVSEKTADLQDFFVKNIINDPEGYAKEAEAYIEESGLLGKVVKTEQSGMDERAAMFIALGGRGKKWDRYVFSFNNPGQPSA